MGNRSESRVVVCGRLEERNQNWIDGSGGGGNLASLCITRTS